MPSINFPALQNLYNSVIDTILASDGLTTSVNFIFNGSVKNLCPNCIYDANLSKSANKYKPGGPIPFNDGQLCPYCNGIGFFHENVAESGYLAVLWDSKNWINPPQNIAIPNNMIQTICDKTYLDKIMRCSEIQIAYPGTNNQSLKFKLSQDLTPVGLGDNNYLFCFWEKVN